MPDWIDPRDHRGEVDDEVYDAVLEAVEAGWMLAKQGHKWRLYCPCGTRDGADGAACSVPGTSRNPGNAARRLRRNLERCPDSHPLIR